MEQKHTPGPWRVEVQDNGVGDVHYVVAGQPDHLGMGVFQVNLRSPENAQLIASAPKLLTERDELLKKVEWHIEQDSKLRGEYDQIVSGLKESTAELLEACEAVKSAHSHIETCDMPEWLDQVEAAIAKAKPLAEDGRR